MIFSGLYSSSGAPAKIIEHFVRGNISVVISQQALEEVIRTIKSRIPEALPALRRLLVSSPPEVIADPEPEEIKGWIGKLSIGDAAILASAIAARPDYLISGDNHFLRNPGLAEETGLRIVTPSQFLKLAGLDWV